jgi:hypothetical protein
MSDAEAPDLSVIEITAIRWFTRRLRLSSFAFLKKAALESKLQPKKSVERDLKLPHLTQHQKMYTSSRHYKHNSNFI